MIIRIDGKPFDVSEYYRRHGHDTLPEYPTMSGLDFLTETGRDPSYRTFLEVEGPEQDIFVPHFAAVLLKEGMSFYVIPPGIPDFGWPPKRVYGENAP